MAGAFSSAYSSAFGIGAGSSFKAAWAINRQHLINPLCDGMKKNVASQKVGAQLVSATDGSAFTGSVTVSVTGDAGTQATGSVGSGACTHEGNGYHTYAPAQAETNYDLVAFTFTGTGAVPVTVQVYTLPATGILAPATLGRTLVVDAAGLADANVVKVGPTGSGTAQTARDIGASVLLAGGRVLPAAEIGDITEDSTIVLRFNTMSSAQAPITLAGSPVLSVYKDSTTQRAGAEITLTVDYDSVTGLHHVSIDTSGDAFYEIGKNYTVVITTGTVGGVSVVGSVVGSFSIENRFAEVDVVKLNGGAQSLLDLKDFADDGYDPSTNKIQGLTTADAVTTVNGLANNVITAASIAADAITAAKIADGAIDAGAIASDAITAAKIADGAIDALTFAAGAITASAIAADAIGASELAADAAAEIASAVRTELATELARVDAAVTTRATPAQVNAEVLDVLNVDTFAEPGQEAPGATVSLVKKLGYLYKAWRNKTTQTATTQSLYADDATTVDQKATVSDDGTTFTKGEIGTGP